MAVIHDYTYPVGAIFPQQYCRVEDAQVTKTRIRYSVGIYLNNDVTNTPPHALEHFETDFDLLSELNVWQQAYAHLKQVWLDCEDI